MTGLITKLIGDANTNYYLYAVFSGIYPLMYFLYIGAGYHKDRIILMFKDDFPSYCFNLLLFPSPMID